MNYKVEFTKNAKKALKKIDKKDSAKILIWLKKNLENCENPRQYGKPLKGNLSELWRYRVGNYRILANIDDNRILISVVDVGHRKEIYERH